MRGYPNFRGAYLSPHLCRAIRQSVCPRRDLAAEIGVSVGTIDAWITGRSLTARGDPRVVQLGARVGVPATACYEDE